MAITPKEYFNILTKGVQSKLASTDIVDGKLRFVEDTGRLYLDIAPKGATPKRVRISDVEDSLTEEQIAEVIAPLPKIYIASDTHRAYVYNGSEWIDLARINLTASDAKDENKMVWFSSSDDGPLYDKDVYYNPAKKEFGSNVINTKTLLVGDMKVTTTETDDEVTVDFF